MNKDGVKEKRDGGRKRRERGRWGKEGLKGGGVT